MKKSRMKMRSTAEKKRLISEVDRIRPRSKKNLDQICKGLGIHSSQYYGWGRKFSSKKAATKRGPNQLLYKRQLEAKATRGSILEPKTSETVSLGYTQASQKKIVDYFLKTEPEKVTIILNI